jgi:hypothetical protein
VQKLAKHWRLVAFAALAVIVFVAWETSLIPHYVNDCTYQYETYTKKCAPNHIVLVLWRHISEFIEHFDKIIGALSGVAVAAFTGTLWWSTRKMWRVTNATLAHAEKTSDRQLRAYVYLEVVGRKYPPPPKISNRYAISLMVKNSGSTWARNLRVRHAMVVDPKTDEPFDFVNWDEIKPSPMVLGPGQEIGMQYRDISGDELQEIIENKRRIFFVAWVTYEDVLSDPPIMRQTQLSRRFNADEEGGVSYSWIPSHNCADDDCPK